MVRRWLAAAALSLSLLPCSARADEKRPLPDYDGRPREKEGAGWWVPRVALFPLYLVHEYGVRRPIRAGVLIFDRNAAESGDPRDRFDVRPIIVLDRGFRPRFGLYFGGRRERTAFRIQADTFGASSYMLGAAAWSELGTERASVEAYGEVIRRPDTIFHGLGPESSPDTRTRVALERGSAGGRLRVAPTTWFQLNAAMGVRGVKFHTPNVERDYVAVVQRLAITLDPRPLERVGVALEPELRRKSGLRFNFDGELAESPSPARTWATYGGDAIATLDVTGTGRIVELATMARFVDPLSGGAAPYIEHATLGGDRYLRGHLPGRLFGRSAFVASAEWRWPIWIFLDGFVRVDAGNVFGPHLRELSPRLFRLSATTGMRHVGTSGYIFELIAGVGTEPINDGARVSSVRVLFSASRPL
jgi:hypothetical protein